MKDRIGNILHDYVALGRDEGISYLFFANFLAYAHQKITMIHLTDSLVRPYITEHLTNYFKIMDPEFDPQVIDTWFEEFY